MARKLKFGRDTKWIKHKRKLFSKAEREYIFKRDNYTCQLCGKDLYELSHERVLDHKIPLSQFGSNEMKNIWLLCNDCDKNKKSDILPKLIKERLNELQNGKNRRHG